MQDGHSTILNKILGGKLRNLAKLERTRDFRLLYNFCPLLPKLYFLKENWAPDKLVRQVVHNVFNTQYQERLYLLLINTILKLCKASKFYVHDGSSFAWKKKWRNWFFKNFIRISFLYFNENKRRPCNVVILWRAIPPNINFTVACVGTIECDWMSFQENPGFFEEQK